MGPRMEKREQYEEAAFYYRATLDFYTSILQLWIGAVYDDQVDEIDQRGLACEFVVMSDGIVGLALIGFDLGGQRVGHS